MRRWRPHTRCSYATHPTMPGATLHIHSIWRFTVEVVFVNPHGYAYRLPKGQEIDYMGRLAEDYANTTAELLRNGAYLGQVTDK